MRNIVVNTVKWLTLNCIATFFFSSQDASAQWRPDTVSVDEMITRFRDFKAGVVTDSLTAYDPLYPGFYGQPIRFADDEVLRRAGNLKLPRSSWRRVVRDSLVEYVTRHGDVDYHKISYLCWTGFLESPAGVDTLALRRKLEKKYGVFREDGVFVGVPATWVTKDLFYYRGLLMYGNTPITPEAHLHRFEKGVSKGSVKSYYSQYGSLREDAFSNYFTPSFNDRTWLTGYKMELFLFQHDLNRLIPKDTTTRASHKPCDLLFYSDAKGKTHLRPIYPELLEASDSVRMQVLRKALDAQPPGIFGVFYTPKGRVFPGRYLRARYWNTSGWSFEDEYLKDE